MIRKIMYRNRRDKEDEQRGRASKPALKETWTICRSI
uniref:Uncharacterized protein n=1 Tax=Arundo donax TaxID=35708 RepID=A0A0A8Y661_ARUDO